MNEATDLIAGARSDDSSTVADLAGAAEGRSRLHPGNEAAPVLVWMGPLEFRARYDDRPHLDRDLGTGWGTRADQRITLRQSIGTAGGMLYVYDPIWDEYAVLLADVSHAGVARAVARMPASETPMSASAFAALVAHHDGAATPETGRIALVPEAAPGIGVSVGLEP